MTRKQACCEVGCWVCWLWHCFEFEANSAIRSLASKDLEEQLRDSAEFKKIEESVIVQTQQLSSWQSLKQH